MPCMGKEEPQVLKMWSSTVSMNLQPNLYFTGKPVNQNDAYLRNGDLTTQHIFENSSSAIAHLVVWFRPALCLFCILLYC
jgi:hypothetical protein